MKRAGTFGVLIVMALASCEREKPVTLPTDAQRQVAKPPATAENGGEVKEASSLRAIKESGESGFVVFTSDGCQNSKTMMPTLSRLAQELPSVNFWEVEATLTGVATPTFVIVKNGQEIDRHHGSASRHNPDADANNRKLLMHMLTRTGLIDGNPDDYYFSDRPISPLPTPYLRGAGLAPSIVDGWSYPNADLAGTSFAGSSVRNADFSGANLDRANFSHADLTGTDLSGASLSDAYWSNTICPDGRVHNEGCAEFSRIASPQKTKP